MTGLDTNVLARYYIQDDSDAEAEQQHLAARNLLESGQPLMVCKTVFLEFEWVMRGYYGFAPTVSSLNRMVSSIRRQHRRSGFQPR
ncbi:MAG: type II toxin-antitoxin system VapC family toxin [Gammaproteobacteria bacterium]|nr:type II toxin-antitoxin system VapC family toxin [Gammaproteobacteria bacterium]